MQIKVSNLYSIMLFLSAIVIPMYFTHFRLDYNGVIIRLADLISIVLIVLFFICLKRKFVRLSAPNGFLILSFFLLYCFISGVLLSGFSKSLVATFQWALLLTTLLVVHSCSVMNKKYFTDVLIKSLLLICFFTIAYHFSIGKFIHYKNLGDAKYALALTGVIVASYVYINKKSRLIYALAILYPFIILSLERKGILVFHLVVFIYILFTYKNFSRLVIFGSFFTLLFLIFFLPEKIELSNYSFFEYSSTEIFALNENEAIYTSNLHRQSLLINGLDIFYNNYIFGVGPKMLASFMVDYYSNPVLGVYTHNVFLDSLIEYGSVGFALLFTPYVIFLKNVKFINVSHAVCFFALCVYSIFMLMFMSGGAPSMIILYLPLILNNVFSPKVV